MNYLLLLIFLTLYIFYANKRYRKAQNYGKGINIVKNQFINYKYDKYYNRPKLYFENTEDELDFCNQERLFIINYYENKIKKIINLSNEDLEFLKS